MKRRCLLFLLSWAAFAFQGSVSPVHRPVDLKAPVLDKNFYLLAALERSPELHAALKADPSLAAITAARVAALIRAAATCKADLDCNTSALRWSDAQIEEGAAALAALAGRSAPLRAFADGPLRATGFYVRYNSLSSPELLHRGWSDCLRGLNRIIDVYGLGKPPRYGAIDSVTYDPKSTAYQRELQNAVMIINEDRAALDLPFIPELRFALQLMNLNNRDEAGRHEPMEKGENAAAFAKVKVVNWAKFAYTAIVVPGSGNDRPGVRLSPGSKLRDDLAARRFHDGKAPFIIVSGGYVHPNQTEFAEAIEMKRDLIANYGIPANAIIVDPHARHTTTNMRNAARLIYRYGLPFDRKALVTTDLSQSASIESPGFAKRCIDEMGYVSQKILGRTSPFDLEFLPMIESLQIDPLDPLDP